MLLFFLTEQLFPLCTDQLNLSTVLKSLGVLLFSAVMAAEIGVSAVWIGYMKRSVVAVTASVILASLGCQLLQFSYLSAAAAGAGVLVLLVPAVLAVRNLYEKILNLEV